MNLSGSQDQQLDAVYQELKKVIDPELGMSIIKLGLVYGLDVREGVVTVTMTLTTRGCPMSGPISDGVRKVVTALPWVKDVVVDLVWEPAWSPAMMR